jgi:hypothetical protein
MSLCLLTWFVVLAGMFAPKAMVDPFEANQFDKLLHSGALMAMVVSARLALPRFPRSCFWGASVLLAFALEALQPIVQTSREFNGMDVVANLIGVVIAALALWLSNLTKRPA